MAAEDRKLRVPGEVVAAMTCVEGVEKFIKDLQEVGGNPSKLP